MKRTIKKRLGTIFLFICCLLTGCSAIVDYRVNHQLDLGNKYLLEFEYDKAMLAYSKALQIEPRQMKAYKGLSDVFTAQNDIDSSINVLKKGISVADQMTYQEKDDDVRKEINSLNTQIVDQLTEMGDSAFDKERYEKAIQYYKDLVIYDSEEENSFLKLSKAYEETGDLEKALEVLQESELSSKILREETDRLAVRYEIKKKYEELLGRLSSLIKANDGELAKEVLLSKDFLDLVAQLTEPLILQQDENQYIVVYPNGYVYMGQMENQMRSGYGDYYTNNSARYVVYSGYWSNDQPNGSGRIDTVVYTDSDSMSPNFYGDGYFEDGISEGQFLLSIFYQNGDRYDYTLECVHGLPPVIRRENGKNVVSYSTTDGIHYFMMGDNSVIAVPGFEKDGLESMFSNSVTIYR